MDDDYDDGFFDSVGTSTVDVTTPFCQHDSYPALDVDELSDVDLNTTQETIISCKADNREPSIYGSQVAICDLTEAVEEYTTNEKGLHTVVQSEVVTLPTKQVSWPKEAELTGADDDAEGSYMDIDLYCDPEPIAKSVTPAPHKATQQTMRPARLPRFAIPKAKFDFLTNQGGQTRGLWTYELYKDINGQQPRLTYCKNRKESEECAKLFLDEPVIGFDMEWRPRYSPGIKTNASLIQLASETNIGLFHIALHNGKTTSELMAPTLKRVLESPDILKTGVCVLNADGRRLKTYFKMEPRGLFELSNLHKVVKFGASDPSQVNKGLVALAKLTYEHLGLPLSKGKVRCSDWSKPLNPAQIRYSASDAYVGYQLFQIMNAKRLSMDPVPPLPAHAELQQSIVLTQADPSDNVVATGEKVETVAKAAKPHALSTQDSSQASQRKLKGQMVQFTSPRPEDYKIHAELRTHRMVMARRDDVPERRLVRDRALEHIAIQHPRTLKELESLPGVGRQSAERFGSVWIAIVKRICGAKEQGSPSLDEAIKPGTAAASPSPIVNNMNAADVGATSNNKFELQGDLAQDQLDARSRTLYSALSGLRIRLAAKADVDRQSVTSDLVLLGLASHQRKNRSISSLFTNDDSRHFNDFATSHGVSLFDFIVKYDPSPLLHDASRSILAPMSDSKVNAVHHLDDAVGESAKCQHANKESDISHEFELMPTPRRKRSATSRNRSPAVRRRRQSQKF